ncbi:unnamed protein product [Porites lobata]|uniref:Uncharacterized protein n=1 Tax=Porites lobata TaxID=104759 RepID=A0ABN8QV18_9CNID|nr:unnamed protein product [Porites lobata]
MSFISARSRRDLREITNLTEFLARSRLFRRNLFHIGEISFVSQKYLSSRASLGETSSVSRPRSQRYYKSRRVLDEISARSHLSFRDLRDITNLAEVLARSRRDLVYLAAISETLQISPSFRRDFISSPSQRHYKSRRDLVKINAISTRSLSSRRDLAYLA